MNGFVQIVGGLKPSYLCEIYILVSIIRKYKSIYICYFYISAWLFFVIFIIFTSLTCLFSEHRVCQI